MTAERRGDTALHRNHRGARPLARPVAGFALADEPTEAEVPKIMKVAPVNVVSLANLASRCRRLAVGLQDETVRLKLLALADVYEARRSL